MQPKPKFTKASKVMSPLTTAGRLDPPEWEMDSHGLFFINKYGPNSPTGKQIAAVMDECCEKCALAKLEMYSKIQEIIKKAH